MTKPPISFTEQCENPVFIPEHNLSQLEVEYYWIQDRSNLAQCRDRHKTLNEFYIFRDSKITGDIDDSIN